MRYEGFTTALQSMITGRRARPMGMGTATGRGARPQGEGHGHRARGSATGRQTRPQGDGNGHRATGTVKGQRGHDNARTGPHMLRGWSGDISSSQPHPFSIYGLNYFKIQDSKIFRRKSILNSPVNSIYLKALKFNSD